MILKLFAVLFVGLKLGSVISWSWFLVLIPIYILILQFYFKEFYLQSIRKDGKKGWAFKFRMWLRELSE